VNQQADTRWLVPHLPEDSELLAALGRVTIRHGFLDHVLKRTVKTLADLTIEEADRALARDGSASLRELIKKIAVQRLGKASTATLKLRALLGECERVTEYRNRVIHDLWARELDGEPLLIGRDSSSRPPDGADLNKLADQIFAVAGQLNKARLDGGFLHAALKDARGLSMVNSVKSGV